MPWPGKGGELQALVLSQVVFDPARAKRTFSIIATDYVHATITEPLFSVLPDIAPGVRIAPLPFIKEKVRDQLEDGTADLCITAEVLTPDEFPARKLLHERFVLILGKSHSSANKRMTLDQFCDLEFVLASPEGGGFEGTVDAVDFCITSISCQSASHTLQGYCKRVSIS